MNIPRKNMFVSVILLEIIGFYVMMFVPQMMYTGITTFVIASSMGMYYIVSETRKITKQRMGTING